MFGERDLAKETHMEKEKRCGIMKNQKIRIILYFYFYQTLDKKLYQSLMSYKFLGICFVHHSLFCIVP